MTKARFTKYLLVGLAALLLALLLSSLLAATLHVGEVTAFSLLLLVLAPLLDAAWSLYRLAFGYQGGRGKANSD